ncbi:hypothetical protein [Natronorubrum daqingense]|uniref:Acetyl-CoA synthetase n=1 Tax=Natronorubrum daqingense TaxID=588898 RepID=A0A1N7DUI1_9EURY|nr:hypothetical protein [Natronorubrum daqingense]APX96182.1 hypothetical protein BB347_05845 [Natronorubrum daqingense]SIR79470.1 hypothetical protein SAMN05421809_2249 [Natronorubrum daqingense]
MNAATVDELLTRDRRDDRTALEDATGRPFDYHWVCTTAWQSGNFLRHAGVRNGVTVGVVGDGPLALLAFFGTTLLEGATRFEPPADLTDEEDFRALVAPVDDLESGEYALPRGAQRVGYGAKPEEPDIHHFDAGVWTENPSFPPLDVDPETEILTDGERTVSHGEVLEAAEDVVSASGLEAGERVVVRNPLSDLETVVAGVVAPLLVGGTVVLTDAEGTEGDSNEARGEYAVSSSPVPESTRIDPAEVRIS